MTNLLAAPLSALGLIFLLGLRHGLDPDHIAVIDNLTFRAAVERPRTAPWMGFLFAVGHSLSVAAIAIGVSMAAGLFRLPVWLTTVVDWAVIVLLIVVGGLNLRALTRDGPYSPKGWRQGFAPKALRDTCHPAAVILIGVIFGLVFDTATQAAAWGLAASSADGPRSAIFISLAFALGMILTDTIDSQIVSSLLLGAGEVNRVLAYRRMVGWMIVILSFGMAIYALSAKVIGSAALPDQIGGVLGILMAVGVIGALWIGRRSEAA
jgi:high-affinity nickel-transport protein